MVKYLILLFSLFLLNLGAVAQTEEVRVYQKNSTPIGIDKFTDQISSFSLVQGEWTVYFSTKGGPFTLPHSDDPDAWKTKLEQIQSKGSEVEVTFKTQSDEITNLTPVAKTEDDKPAPTQRAPAAASGPTFKAVGPWSQKDFEDILKAAEKKK